MSLQRYGLIADKNSIVSGLRHHQTVSVNHVETKYQEKNCCISYSNLNAVLWYDSVVVRISNSIVQHGRCRRIAYLE